MIITLVAATEMEIKPAIQFLENNNHHINQHIINVLIGGVGLMNTTYQLLEHIHEQKPHYIIQAGIAGSFDLVHEPGTVVMVEEEIIGDQGVEENGVFKDVFDMGFADSERSPFIGKMLINQQVSNWKKEGYPLVRGISVNEVTTKADRIEILKSKYGAVVESMEGAALHYVCLKQNIPFIQMRAVSNYVGERDKTKWKIAEAITRLNENIIQIIQQAI